jgi:protein-S-isoprenylcysteine O-methyltransferase Ste14
MQTPTESEDLPGVIIFPPFLLLSLVILSIVLGRLRPLRILPRFSRPARVVAGAATLVSGIGLAASANRQMETSKTNVNPFKPSLQLVTQGPFGVSRNPIYVGGFLALLGLGLVFSLDWVFLLFLPGAMFLEYGVIRPEERYLERIFGARYRDYRSRVRRYL